MARRVAVTGIGIISALGRGAAEHLDAVVSARGAVRAIESIDTASLSCRIAGEVPASAFGEQDVDADRFTRLALIAASDAMAEANHPGLDPERFGCIIGTGLGGATSLDATYHRLYAGGQTRLHPLSIPRAMYNAATSAVAARHKTLAGGFSIVSACASGTHSIGQAFHWIRDGVVDYALAGAADAPIAHGVIRGWEAMRVLAIDNDNPPSACRPFSADRKGMVLGEGAAVLFLEAYDQAAARGASIVGEIAGFGFSLDGGHLTDPSAAGAARAMSMALRDAKLAASEIDYVNAHGTGTRANDVAETTAIRQALGQSAERVAVSSTKAMHGHAMGASGAIELALSLIALRNGVIPATINYTTPDPACDLDYVPNEARRGEARTMLSNSFGFGGMNAVIAARSEVGAWRLAPRV